jgi:hypothetical protein
MFVGYQFRNYKCEGQLHSTSEANQNCATDHSRNILGRCADEGSDESESLATN